MSESRVNADRREGGGSSPWRGRAGRASDRNSTDIITTKNSASLQFLKTAPHRLALPLVQKLCHRKLPCDHSINNKLLSHGASAQSTFVSKKSCANPACYKRQECEKQSRTHVAFKTQEGPSPGQGVACAREAAEGACGQADCDTSHGQ